MSETTPEVVSAIAELVRSGAGPQSVPNGNVPYVLVPEGHKAQALPELIFNDHNATPERVKATVSLLDPASFIEYFKLFSDDASRVFAYEPEIKVTAVFDYHESGVEPRWGQHRAVLSLRRSEEWQTWTGSNNKQFTQAAFAEFLEQNAMDIETPQPAQMMEIARDLQATTEVEFGSAQRMQDGQVRFKYTESTKATMGGGAIAVPERFMLTLPIFVGGSEIDIEAMLRFRVKEGKLVIWYTLVRPESATRNAFLAARNQIAEALSITILNGSAPA